MRWWRKLVDQGGTLGFEPCAFVGMKDALLGQLVEQAACLLKLLGRGLWVVKQAQFLDKGFTAFGQILMLQAPCGTGAQTFFCSAMVGHGRLKKGIGALGKGLLGAETLRTDGFVARDAPLCRGLGVGRRGLAFAHKAQTIGFSLVLPEQYFGGAPLFCNDAKHLGFDKGGQR